MYFFFLSSAPAWYTCFPLLKIPVTSAKGRFFEKYPVEVVMGD
jgi:hypothetical protein